ncbi:hypothetical protein BAY61_01570 [Prauserella marina]|uniref:Uncharacterized protein n=1 Tax=Prauserella marina TaxID=530584 RepID=A0A222VJ32_9PSEU|nr:hypothetical protein [Prauserella marina]ASR33894.1 hypothetical protein BAY61_01570 [Prauserella marina]PWV82489.1 hypothetical protein DES30_102732 [Prauserella marina]SDC70421.1 hypothetical protein SAMN05421630_103268 [Prauserella marina]
MFVSLRLGLLVRVLLVAAAVAGVLVLALSAGSQIGASQSGDRGSPTGSVLAKNAPAGTNYRVMGTDGAGLNVRACPDADCVKVGWVEEGDRFVADCWQRGAVVGGNPMWLNGSVDGRSGFAAGHYLRPDTGVGAPACADPVRLTE